MHLKPKNFPPDNIQIMRRLWEILGREKQFGNARYDGRTGSGRECLGRRRNSDPGDLWVRWRGHPG
jgi:hypothetical protein